MAQTGKPATRRVASVERAMRLLEALADAGGELGTNEASRRTGINASSVSRVLSTLVDGGLVEYREATGRYRLGVRLVRLGNAARESFDLWAAARERMDALAASTGETATLSVPGQGVAQTIHFVQSPASVQSVARVGRPSVAHATSVGKVYLGWGGAVPEGELPRYTDQTITDPAALAAHIEVVRQQGWAEADREREPDLAGVAVPIFGEDGLIAILGVQGPADRFDAQRRAAAVTLLVDEAATLSMA